MSDAEKKVDDELKPSGWLLENKNVIFDIDSSQKIIKVQFTQAGGFTKNSQKNLQSAENFQILMKYVDDVLKETGEKILQGMIDAYPFRSNEIDPCKYCDFNELCNFNSKIDNFRTSTLDDNEKIFAEMKNQDTGLNF